MRRRGIARGRTPHRANGTHPPQTDRLQRLENKTDAMIDEIIALRTRIETLEGTDPVGDDPEPTPTEPEEDVAAAD